MSRDSLERDIHVDMRGGTQAMALDQVQLGPLLASIYGLYRQLYLDRGRRGDLLFAQFCLYVAKDCFIWDILVDRNKDLKTYVNTQEILVQLLQYARLQHMRLQRRPLFVNQPVLVVLSSSHLSARQMIYRIACFRQGVRQTRVPSIELLLPAMKSKLLQFGSSTNSKGIGAKTIRTLPSMESTALALKASDFLYASEVKELYHFLEVCRAVQAQSSEAMCSKIITDTKKLYQLVKARVARPVAKPFSPNGIMKRKEWTVPVTLVETAAKEAEQEQIKTIERVIDKTHISKNALLSEFNRSVRLT